MKRLTILQREYLERGKGGYFNTEYSYIYLDNCTDKMIAKYLDEVNTGLRTRLYEKYKDFDLSTKKGIKEFIIYAIDSKDERLINLAKDEMEELK